MSYLKHKTKGLYKNSNINEGGQDFASRPHIMTTMQSYGTYS